MSLRRNKGLGLGAPKRRVSVRDLWSLFSQTVTLILAVLFVVALFRPGIISKDDRSLLGRANSQDITFSASLSRVMPSVVSILMDASGSNGANVEEADYNIGSGVIVSKEGHILTNNHVIEDGGKIEVITSEGVRMDATLVGADDDIDIAVLKVESAEPLPAARFKDRDQPVKVGDLVMSIGSPYGLPNTASLGIISAIGRNALGLSRYEHFIQTDAAINHGSSGGALANVNGELIGINTAIFTKRFEGSYAQGIGFAIPSELVEVAYDHIVEHGKFRRGWIGLELGHLDPINDERTGTDAWVVNGVATGSPAYEAGIREGDLLTAINGRPKSSVTYLEEATGELLVPGEGLELSLVRNGEPYEAYVLVKEL